MLFWQEMMSHHLTLRQSECNLAVSDATSPLTMDSIHIRGLSKKFVEFVNKNKSTNVVALKFLHVKDPFKPDKICEFQTNR